MEIAENCEGFVVNTKRKFLYLNRPNPIGKATVRLLERHGNVLRVQGLDAINGMQVIDIKPYIPGSDSVTNAKVPPWITSR